MLKLTQGKQTRRTTQHLQKGQSENRTTLRKEALGSEHLRVSLALLWINKTADRPQTVDLLLSLIRYSLKKLTQGKYSRRTTQHL